MTELANPLISVLENHAFAFAEAGKAVLSDFDSDSLVLKISFSGMCRGNMEMVITRNLSLTMTAGILGTEPDEEILTNHLDDAMKELLNITAGFILTENYGADALYDLSIPELHTGDTAVISAMLCDAHTVTLDVDGEKLLFRVTESGISA